MGKDGDVKWYNTFDHFDLKTKKTKKDIYFNLLEKNPDGGYLIGANTYAVKGDYLNDSFLLVRLDKNGVGCNDVQPVSYNPINVIYTQPDFTLTTGDATSFLQVADVVYTKSNKALSTRTVCTTASPGIAITATLKENISSKDELELTLKTYPNPAKDILVVDIKMNKPAFICISISTVYGKKIYSERTGYSGNGVNKTINISSLSTGIYLLIVSDGKNQKTIKFIKQ
ncbi:hypothetical protein BH10BAC2_BH10BAC2_20070 [soil metagenome]